MLTVSDLARGEVFMTMRWGVYVNEVVFMLIVSDPDGDEVRCRFSNGFDECGGVCNGVPGAIINEVSTSTSKLLQLFCASTALRYMHNI